MCQAVTGALLTETNPDKLHAFAETVRAQYPQAAEALDSKAAVFGWGGGPSRANGHATSGRANGHGQAHATGGNGASRPGAAHAHATGQAPAERPWVQVASDMSNVPPSSLAAEVASMPQGVAFGQGGGVPGIMGASRPEIVSSGQAAAEEAAKDGMPMMMEAELAAEARPRPRPSVYVKLRHGDSVWPVKLAKIGSGNKSSFDQLVAMNPHLVSPSGAWAQMFPGDEVCIPPVWAENLRARGFLIKSDFAGE